MRNILLALLAFASIACSAAAQTSFVTSYSTLNLWLPILLLALILSASLIGIYYAIGSALHNNKVVSRAVIELGQVVGTAVIVVIIIFVFAFVGSGFSYLSVISPKSVLTLCNQLSTSQVQYINSVGTLGGSQNNPTPTGAVCSAVSDLSQGSGSLTSRLDYGLFASYLIVANLTNQAANNLNAFYGFQGWIGFLSQITPEADVSVPEAFSLSLKITPLKGYLAISDIARPAELEAGLSFYLLFIQMLMTILFLYAWPYMIAAGVLLRTTFFGRRTGGLLIAAGVSVVLLFPMMYILEYTAFTNKLLAGPIGASSLPSLPLYQRAANNTVVIYGETPSGSSNMNPFVLPNATGVLELYSCLPGDLWSAISSISSSYTIPFSGYSPSLFEFGGGFINGEPATPPGSCGPTQAIGSVLALTNLYGITFVAAVMLPLFNVIIAIAATLGLSRLMGGESDILGLSKLI